MIENHVTSLELAKKLAEAGYPQENGYAYWQTTSGSNKTMIVGHHSLTPIKQRRYYFAPLATELLEELPKRIIASSKISNISSRDVSREYMLLFGFKNGEYWLRYRITDDYLGYTPEISDEHFPNALAKLWLYLTENNLLEGQE